MIVMLLVKLPRNMRPQFCQSYYSEMNHFYESVSSSRPETIYRKQKSKQYIISRVNIYLLKVL